MQRREEFIIGVDIGGTNTVVGLVGPRGSLHTSTIETMSKGDPALFVNRLRREITTLQGGIPPESILKGIGIASPAANSQAGTIEDPANFSWGTVAIVNMMKKYFDIPIAITNDGNAAALGEMEFGVARGMRNFIVITLGTGVGSGIVVDRRLLFGQNGWAGELGHVIIEEAGRECGCGRAGCLETYISAPGICRTTLELLASRHEESALRNIGPRDLTAQTVCEHARNGDLIAIEAFEIAGTILGRWLANATAIFDPEAFILFGGVANAGEILLKPVRASFTKHLMNFYRGRVQLVASQLQKGHAGVLGASVLISRPEYFPSQEPSDIGSSISSTG